MCKGGGLRPIDVDRAAETSAPINWGLLLLVAVSVEFWILLIAVLTHRASL
jgi:hypothetical protein